MCVYLCVMLLNERDSQPKLKVLSLSTPPHANSSLMSRAQKQLNRTDWLISWGHILLDNYFSAFGAFGTFQLNLTLLEGRTQSSKTAEVRAAAVACKQRQQFK